MRRAATLGTHKTNFIIIGFFFQEWILQTISNNVNVILITKTTTTSLDHQDLFLTSSGKFKGFPYFLATASYACCSSSIGSGSKWHGRKNAMGASGSV